MVQLIVGRKGKGKTKHLLDKVNTEVKDIAGNVVYLDKSTKHMFELNNKIRLINVSDYMITNSDEFIGFICGIISQDHDLQQMYFDSFLKIACMEDSAADSEKINAVIGKLEAVSTKFNVDFVLSISLDAHELSEDLKSKVIVSL
ncbi:MAG: twitching motility protein PilT [Lachnospiraceae bacterium]|nr:twitching motility protein PilT [Lachnospiraceae bacterium]